MKFHSSFLIPTLTITTLGVLILGWVIIGVKGEESIETEKASFTTQQVTPTFTVSGGTTITTIDPNTCMTTEIPVCKKRFWKDFDDKTCKEVTFEVDCMFYDEVSNNQQEYTKLLSEYGLVGREETNIACDALLIDTIIVNGYACEEKDLGQTISDINTQGMCRDNSRTCKKVIREGKEVLLREKNLSTRYDPTGKTEICDGRDNDCDGQVDEGYQQKEYLRDFDSDGRGNIEMKTKACFPPPGHVLKAGDCDDLDKSVYPGAYEVCDLNDNNCNRQIDEYLVDCNEEVKECTVMLPENSGGSTTNTSEGTDNTGGNNINTNGGTGNTGGNNINTSEEDKRKIIQEKLITLYPQYKEEINNAGNFIDGINSFYNKTYGKDFFKIINEIFPLKSISYFDTYKNQSYASEILEKAVRNAVETDSLMVLLYFDTYKDQTYAYEILELAARNTVKTDPLSILAHYNVYKDQPYAYEILELAARNAAKTDTLNFLMHFDKYESNKQSYASEVLEIAIRNAVKTDPLIALDYFYHYKDKPYALEILNLAVNINPGRVLEYFETYKNQPYASEILEKAVRNAAKTDPGRSLEYFDEYKDKSYASEILELSVRNAVQTDPGVALEYFDTYKKKKYASEMLELAARNAAQTDPGAALKYFDTYKDKSYASEILELATRNAAKIDPGAALMYFDTFKNKPYAYEILKLVVVTKPGSLLAFFDKYKDQPYASEIFNLAVRNAEPGQLLLYSDKFKDQPYAFDILNLAIKTETGEAFKYFYQYKDQPYAFDILESLTKANPLMALQYFDEYNDQPYAFEILKLIVNIDPLNALKFFDKYKDQPYAFEILEGAVRNAAKTHHWRVIEYFDLYKDEPYAFEILEIVTKTDPGAVLMIFNRFIDQHYAYEILELAARNAAKIDPGSALNFFDTYKDQPYAFEILDIIVNNPTFGINKNIEEIIKKLNSIKAGAGDLHLDKILTNSDNRADILFLYSKGGLFSDNKFDGMKGLFNDLFKIQNLKIANKNISLGSVSHINLYAGILKTYINKKEEYTSNGVINREKVKKDYEANLVKFINAGKNFSINTKINTFIVRADVKGGDDPNGATINNDILISLFQCLGKKGTCTVIRSNEITMTPDEIIALFAKQIHDDPEGYHLFHLGAHGGENGSLYLAGGSRTKEHFNKLFNLQVAHPGRIRIDIISCNSFWKDDNRNNNTIGNISLDSSQHPSYGGEKGTDATLLAAFEKKDTTGNLEADYDEDGVVNYHEALIYRAINYNQSLTPIMFEDNGKVIDIVGAEILPQEIQDRSNRENDPFVDTQCSMDC